MKRSNDWPERLVEVISAAETRPFEWGQHDCALFACGVIEALTGRDPAAKYRGHYKTARGAAGHIRRSRVADLEELAARLAEECGFDEISPAFGQRGDLVLVGSDLGPALGIVLGREVALAGPDGLTRLSLLTARRAWRVG